MSRKKRNSSTVIFDGELSGAAKKRFYKRARIMGQKALAVSIALLFPTIIWISLFNDLLILLNIFVVLVPLIFILTYIPFSVEDFTPKKIVLQGKIITCYTAKYVESRYLKEIKKVYDYPEFYEIDFVFGKVSEKFICQKEHLVSGSLEEFEQRFAEKIEKGTRGRFCCHIPR